MSEDERVLACADDMLANIKEDVEFFQSRVGPNRWLPFFRAHPEGGIKDVGMNKALVCVVEIYVLLFLEH